LLNKGLLAVLLLVFVAMTGQLRAAGLAGGMNLRTLPDYWPMFLLMALILGGPVSPPETGMLLALAGIAFSVGFAEELMFRGLVFHWFRDQSVRRQILISALAFGGAHLGGLLVTDAAAVIVAQSIFASGVGAIIASARARDRSIWLPIVIHAGFDFAAFAAAGSVGGALVDSPATVVRLLVAAIIVWLWAARLIWRAPRYELADVSV
jgi:membrane protease YdiL (CAAX protease family)